MRDLKLLKQMKEEYGITFSDNPCYYNDNNIITDSQIPEDNDYKNIIYENINPRSGCVELKLCPTERFENQYKSEMFRTTYSMKIGEIENFVKKIDHTKYDVPEMEIINNNETIVVHEMLQIEESINEPQLIMTENEAELNDELEESSYKSSYAKLLADSYHRRNNPSDSIYLFQSYSEEQPTYEEISRENKGNDGKKCEELIQQMVTLYKKLTRTEEDLNTAQKEILALKLESARLKAENRSIRAAEAVINTPIKWKEKDKQTISNSKPDTWTLQQKVIHLTTQLEKAEITKHAYESATAQLVMFLKTITSTLLPLYNEDHLSEKSNVSHTAGMLTDIENALIDNNKFDYSRERSFVRMNNIKNSISGIAMNKVANQKIKDRRHKLSNSFNSNSSAGTSVKKNHRKLTKKRSNGKLRKSESFSDLPLDNNLPRVARTLSADVICIDGKCNSKHQKSSLKNKSIFSSLRNVFKIEGDKHIENCKKSKKKKKGFLSFSKRTKRIPSPNRSDDCPHSLQSSTFYVSCPNSEEEHFNSLPACEELPTLTIEDSDDLSPSELLSGPREISVTLSMMDLNMEDIGTSGYVNGKDGEVEIARRKNEQCAESCSL